MWWCKRNELAWERLDEPWVNLSDSILFLFFFYGALQITGRGKKLNFTFDLDLHEKGLEKSFSKIIINIFQKEKL